MIPAFGCSGGGDPSAPGLTPDMTLGAAGSPRGEPTNHMLWGLWDISIDPLNQTCDIIPIRGAMFNANVTRFLQPPSAPVNLLSVIVLPTSDFSTGHLELDITLRHPFVGLHKFRGFDVRGIVMGDGDVPFSFDSTVFRAGMNDLVLENADGWTRWWNPTEFMSYDTILGFTHGSKAPPNYYASATINPYKYFCDDLDNLSPLSDILPENRGTFSVDPGINTRTYVLQFPRDPSGIVSFRFNYAIDASWALPDQAYEPYFPPEAYPPEANAQEAWWTTLDDTGSTAWYVDDDWNGGQVHLNVEVYDWQGAMQPSGVASEVAAIYLDSALFEDPVEVTSIGSVGPGGPSSSVWQADIFDLQLTRSGDFDCWIAVEADNPSNYAPQIEGDPYLFDWPDAPLRAYAFGTLHVSGETPIPPPIVEFIVPPQGEQSTVVPDLEVHGANFLPGAEVDFWNDLPTELDISDVQWISESVIMCDVDCNAPLGFYNVTVMNPDLQEGTLEDGFEVIEPEGFSIWWQSHMYNDMNYGRNPTVPGADPNLLSLDWSSPVGGDKKYTTPVVADNKIYFSGNNGFYANESMTVHCFDLITGEELWSNPINPSGYSGHRAFAAPVWWEGPDGTNRIAVGGDQVYCYDADSGDELWTFDAMIDTTDVNWISNQMQEHDGMVLARSRFQRLYVLDFITGAEITVIDCAQTSEGGCGAKDGLVYISSGHRVECADILTGENLWSTLLPHDANISHWINPSIVEDRLYVSTYDGYVFALAIEGNASYMPGEIIWEWFDSSEVQDMYPLVGGTSVVDDKIFVAAAFYDNYVYCIQDEGDSASTFWKSSTVGYFDASPVWSSAPSYPEGVVYCPDRGGYIRAYDASNGVEIWAHSTGGELRAGVSPVLDLLIVTSGTDVSVFKGP